MRQLTHGPRHHFFGRAGVSPWNSPGGTRIACLETDFQARPPEAGEKARVGIVDPNTGGFSVIATTAAWSFPHGAMLAWCPAAPDEELLFNDLVDGSPVGVRLNVLSGARHLYMRPFAATGGEAARVASVNLGRIARLHPDEGLAGAADPWSDDSAPENDGLFVFDLSAGIPRLLVSVASVAAEACASVPALRRREFWFEQAAFNPPGSRLLFTVFAGGAGPRPDGALYTIGIDGSDLREVVPFGRGVTRGAWLDARSGVATFRGKAGVMMPRVFADGPPTEAPLSAEDLQGMATVSPDGALLAIESENLRRRAKVLSIFDRGSGELTALGSFPVADERLFHGPARCDLSPRWNADGTVICVDAIDAEGTRQMHLVLPASRDSVSRSTR